MLMQALWLSSGPTSVTTFLFLQQQKKYCFINAKKNKQKKNFFT